MRSVVEHAATPFAPSVMEFLPLTCQLLLVTDDASVCGCEVTAAIASASVSRVCVCVCGGGARPSKAVQTWWLPTFTGLRRRSKHGTYRGAAPPHPSACAHVSNPCALRPGPDGQPVGVAKILEVAGRLLGPDVREHGAVYCPRLLTRLLNKLGSMLPVDVVSKVMALALQRLASAKTAFLATVRERTSCCAVLACARVAGAVVAAVVVDMAAGLWPAFPVMLCFNFLPARGHCMRVNSLIAPGPW